MSPSPRLSVLVARHEGDSGAIPALLAQQIADAPSCEIVFAGPNRNPVQPSDGVAHHRVEGTFAGAAEAWNAAAAVAAGERLVFLRGDSLPEPALIRGHGGLEDELAIGLGDVAQAGDKAESGPLDGGGRTLSVDGSLFRRLGGFTPGTGWSAEAEFTARAIQAGGRLRQLSGTTAKRSRFRPSGGSASAAEAGRRSVALYQQAPELLPHLQLGAFGSVGFRARWLCRVLLAGGQAAAPRLVERVLAGGDRDARWERFALTFAYWRGVRAAVPDRDTWRRLVLGPVILMYHAIGSASDRPGVYIVPERRFARQMAWLALARYQVIGLETLVECRRAGRLPPARAVVLTFDDGYADNHDRAFPVLRKRGFPATFFVVSGRIGSQNTWDTSGELSGRPLVSWPQLRAMLAGGMEIGGHTRGHPRLPELDGGAIAEEVGECRRELEATLERPIRSFAYPFGRYDDRAIRAVEAAGYQAACCSRSGVCDPAAPDLLLRRLEVRGTDSLFGFALGIWRGRAGRRRVRSA